MISGVCNLDIYFIFAVWRVFQAGKAFIEINYINQLTQQNCTNQPTQISMQEQPKFKTGVWVDELNVRDFVAQNVPPYDGDSSFLCGPTEKTRRVWEHCLQALK